MNLSKPQTWSPLLVLAAIAAGGFLLNQLLKRPALQQTSPGPAARPQPAGPAAHMGAREEQIDHTMQHPPASELATGGTSATGAAYALDPDSVTPG